MSYQVHASYEHWNVALWLYNDEGLYNALQIEVKSHDDAHEAAASLYNFLVGVLPETPDGVAFTPALIEAAIADEYD